MHRFQTHRIIVFACVLSTSLATLSGLVRAAEPIEATVAEWVNAIDSAPDWSANFDSVTYEQATDTATVTGLTVSNTATGFAVAFQPIAIAGYAETGDGTFGAASVVSDGMTVKGDGLQATVSGIRYEGLENVARNVGELITWDPEQPFTSLIQAYARFLDIRLARSTVDTVSMTIEEQGEKIDIGYEGVVVEDWAGGKIGRVATGSIAIAGAGIEEPFTVSIDGTEARGIDYAAFLRIYDPDQYVGGVGDGIWRNAVELIRYDTFAVESADTEIIFGELNIENFRVRQPERSFAELLDKAMLDPDREEEPTPEELRQIFSYLSSFAIGSMSLNDVAVTAGDDTKGHLGEMRLVDASFERLEEFSLDDIKVSTQDGGEVDIGHVSVGGVVFPPLTALIEAAEAEETGEPFDYATLTTRLASFEAGGIAVDLPAQPHFGLDNARLDLDNYVGTIPTSIDFDLTGADVPSSLIDDPSARGLLQALGYDRVRADISARMVWTEDDERLKFEDVRMAVDRVGALSFSAVFEGISREALADYARAPERLAEVNFVGGALMIENYDVLDRWIDQQAAMTGSEPTAFRQQVAIMVAEFASGVGNSDFQAQLRRVLQASVTAPGSITVTARPPAPVPVVALGVLAQTAPMSLPDLLDITIDGPPGGNR